MGSVSDRRRADAEQKMLSEHWARDLVDRALWSQFVSAAVQGLTSGRSPGDIDEDEAEAISEVAAHIADRTYLAWMRRQSSGT